MRYMNRLPIRQDRHKLLADDGMRQAKHVLITATYSLNIMSLLIDLFNQQQRIYVSN